MNNTIQFYNSQVQKILSKLQLTFKNTYLQNFTLLFIFFSHPLVAQVSSNVAYFMQVNTKTTTKSIPSSNFEAWLKTKGQLSEELTLKPLHSETDKLGITHQRYQILQSNIPIEGSVIISHSDAQQNLLSSNGHLFHLPNISNIPSISPKEALQKATEYVGAAVYRWEIEAENQHRNHLTKGEKTSYLPIPSLVFAPTNLNYEMQDFRLCYKIDIYALQPHQRLWVYIDAHSGEVVAEESQLCYYHSDSTVDKVCNRCQNLSRFLGSVRSNLSVSLSQRSKSASTVDKVYNRCQNLSRFLGSVQLLADTPATALTKYSGEQTITTFQQNNTFLLQETTRNIFTYDMHQNNLFSQATIFEDDDNYWDNFNEDQDEVATDVHWGTERTYDYFLERHGRKSFDGNGIAIRSYAHYINPLSGSTFANAFWDGEHLVYGDGDGEKRSAMTSLDICAHEYTHAVTDYTANLISARESGALNESFSDIFAIAVEHYAKGAAANFLLGDEVALEGTAIRSSIRPKVLENPDTYQGEYWSYDQVHNRSNVQTHWFYLLVNGGIGVNDFGNSYAVEGIGLEKAVDIAYRNLTVYLTPPSGYADARFFSIRAAMDLFGDCSFEAEQVAKAWYAVGVGVETLEVVADFSIDETEFCSETATVQFTNHSLWADSFTWDFGDGNSSQEVHPTHTYQGAGEYTVQLTANACNEGTNTKIEENAVHLGESVAPCNEVDLDWVEQAILQDCKGILYDDGGKEGDYTRFKESRATIEVADADYLTLDFTWFDASNNHELYLYNGRDDKAPLIGVYWGSRLPNDGATIVTKGNVVHVRFNTNGGENRSFSGFAMEWACQVNARKPQAEFTSNEAFICQGQVSFQEKTLYQATEWHWDFGDGNSSQEPNPTHTYTQNGVYDVQLVACNDFGCDTLQQVALVRIDAETLDCFETKMPKTGTTKVAHCSGRIFDNGGEFGFYSNKARGTVVVEPPNVERLGFAIQSFTTETKDDLLLVYDGDNRETPLLLSQSGFEFSEDTIWASSGALTFHFRSDEELFNPGFEIVYFSEAAEEAPQAAFAWSMQEIPVSVPVNFQNQSQKANQWLWDFGDGTVSNLRNPVHVYVESGEYRVTLVAKNCYTSDTLQRMVTVQSTPTLLADKATLEVTLPAGETTTELLTLSNIGGGDLFFGLETEAFEQDTIVEKFYTDLGIDTYVFDGLRPQKELRLELTLNGDFDDDLEYVQLWIDDEDILQAGINNQSEANGNDIQVNFAFSATSSQVTKWLSDGQLKVEVGKSNQVSLNQGGKDYYRLRVVTDHADWLQVSSSNGVIGGSNDQELLLTFNTKHLWAGTYTNTLRVFNNDLANSLQSIPIALEVLPRPIAQFSHRTVSICAGRVAFSDESLNEVQMWAWDFGDGATSNEQHPTHEYAEGGVYEVTLEVCHSGICDVSSQTVSVAPIARFSFSPNEVPYSTEIRFTNQSVGLNSYQWDFGDGATSSERNPKHFFEVDGTYAVTLTAENCFGTATMQKEVVVQGLPQASVALDTVKLALEAGNQQAVNIPVQNLGAGDLTLQSVAKRVVGESTVVYEETGATTVHRFENVVASDFLQLRVTLNGDFDAEDERVWVRLEGEGVAYVVDANLDTDEDATYVLDIAQEFYRHLLADGVLEVELENSAEVELRLDRANTHRVELVAYGVPWLALPSTNVKVPIGQTREIAVTFDARDLNVGVYEMPVTLTSNEFPPMEYVLLTRLEVTGVAALELSAEVLDFGELHVGEVAEYSFQIYNSGTDVLWVEELMLDSEVFALLNSESAAILPKSKREYWVQFQPNEILGNTVNLEIQSFIGSATLQLKGEGIGLPKLSVLPDSLWVTLEVGKQTSRVVTLSNTGTHALQLEGKSADFTRLDSLSMLEFAQIGDTTRHVFEGLEETDSLRLSFALEGDYNEAWEFVEVYVNGVYWDRLGVENADSVFVVEADGALAWGEVMEGASEEGRLEVVVVNSEEVNTGLTDAQTHAVGIQTFDVPWMDGNLAETTLAVGESRDWELEFDATNLPIGIYYQEVELFSDDPEREKVVVPTTLEVVDIVGVEEQRPPNGIRIYPNPVEDRLYVELENVGKQVWRGQLWNVYGQLVAEFEVRNGQAVVEVGDLAKGMYFLVLGDIYTIENRSFKNFGFLPPIKIILR